MPLPAAALALALVTAAPAGGVGFTVAIDPGHGGSNSGAASLSAGLAEKHITLDIAKRMKERLAKERGVTVVLCRTHDVMVPIRTRVRCANDARADLFISLHANASPLGPRRGTQEGFELYVLPVADVERDAATAAIGVGDDAAAAWVGHEVFSAAATAVEAGRRIAWRFVDLRGPERDRGMKQQGALLDVLQGLRVPGVLVEVGFLDHPEEGKWLTSPEGRAEIAEALAGAVTDLRARKGRAQADMSITAPASR